MRRITASRRRAVSSSLYPSITLDFPMPEIIGELTIPLYAAVGRAASRWASFEHQIQVIIWNLADIESILAGACVTSQIGNSARLLDAVLSLLSLKGATDDDLKPLRSFCERVAKKQRKRNRIVHDEWYFRFNEDGTVDPSRLEITASKKLVYGLIAEDIKSIETFIADTEALHSELISLTAHWTGIHSSS